jgi:isopentenyldiphosphate isomerase
VEIQTYSDNSSWKNGDALVKDVIVDKALAHDKDMLHLSVHLLIIDEVNRILSRKRKDDDFRYAGLWTSTIGTHVELGKDYLQTLETLLPISLDLFFQGEFRVHDEFENEVNGLYVMKVNEENLPTDFLRDRKFFEKEELKKLITKGKTTPHLKGAFELLELMEK